jgi:hypothetical protein
MRGEAAKAVASRAATTPPKRSRAMTRLCALSVDLDPIGLYHRIHGLSAPDRERANAALDLALDRFLDFASIAGIPLTLFVVGRELERPTFAQRLASAALAGHELGNHTLDHPYDLVRLSREQQREQIEAPVALCQRLIGVRPRGFRAPGYVVTDDLLELVRASGHLYDSSVFPSPAYYAAKAAARAKPRLAPRSRSAAEHQKPSSIAWTSCAPRPAPTAWDARTTSPATASPSSRSRSPAAYACRSSALASFSPATSAPARSPNS